MTCTYNPVKINQCPEVTDLSVNNCLLCKSCCIPSRKFMNVLEGETVVSGDLVMKDGDFVKPWDEASAADIIGVADCSAEATADCPGQVCIYVRDAVLKCGCITIPAGMESDVEERLEELRIFTAFTI